MVVQKFVQAGRKVIWSDWYHAHETARFQILFYMHFVQTPILRRENAVKSNLISTRKLIPHFVRDLTSWRQFLMRLSCYWWWFRQGIVKVPVDHLVDTQTTLTMLWRNSFSVTGQTFEKLNCRLICLFFTIVNCQILHFGSLTRRINYKFTCLSAYWRWKLANERARISAVITKEVSLKYATMYVNGSEKYFSSWLQMWF